MIDPIGADWADIVPGLLRDHPNILRVTLAGSRERGEPTPLSDWDFTVETDDFGVLAADLPALMAPLQPLVVQWDRLAPQETFMLIVPGPEKIDLLFDDVPRELDGPWVAGAETLAGMDEHFWDWVLWLAGKLLRGREEMVADELVKMHQHLLCPMGVEFAPSSLGHAVDAYVSARQRLARKFNVDVGLRLGNAVQSRLQTQGVLP